MKTKLKFLKGKLASSLLVTLFMMTILAVSIAGYLFYIEQQNKLSVRAQSWNVAMAISEAGIEEGLEALNSWPGVDCPPSSQFTGSGWSAIGNNTFTMQRSLPNGSYIVTNDLSDCYHPVITSRAFVTPPTLASGPSGFFYAAVTVLPSSSSLSRAVQVTTVKDTIWKASLAARHSIGMNGGSSQALVNSFDDTLNGGIYNQANALSNAVVASLDGTVSVGNWTIDGKVAVSPSGSSYVGPNGTITGGVTHDANFNLPDPSIPDYSQYFGPNIPGTNVPTMLTPGSSSNTCALSGLLGTNQFATTNVSYYTNLSPSGCPFTVIGSSTNLSILSSNRVVTFASSNLICGPQNQNGNTLPANWCSFTQQGSGNSKSYKWSLVIGTNATYLTNTVYTYATNTTIIDAQTNYTVNTSPTWVTNGYDHVVCGTYYITDPGALSGSTYVSCPSTIVCVNGVSLSGQDEIIVAPGAKLSMYSSGDVSIKGNGVINNAGAAEDFSLVCTTNVQNVVIGGNGQFTGTILAPGATVKMNGGGSTDYDVIGAIMANDITMSGHMSFHFPESLYKSPSALRYLVQSWKELDH